MQYRDGVLDDAECNAIPNIQHAVTMVGYGEDKKQGKYWNIKNSWGNRWGNKGYIKIKRSDKPEKGSALV
jgi:cathepsin L